MTVRRLVVGLLLGRCFLKNHRRGAGGIEALLKPANSILRRERSRERPRIADQSAAGRIGISEKVAGRNSRENQA